MRLAGHHFTVITNSISQRPRLKQSHRITRNSCLFMSILLKCWVLKVQSNMLVSCWEGRRRVGLGWKVQTFIQNQNLRTTKLLTGTPCSQNYRQNRKRSPNIQSIREARTVRLQWKLIWELSWTAIDKGMITLLWKLCFNFIDLQELRGPKLQEGRREPSTTRDCLLLSSSACGLPGNRRSLSSRV